VVSLTVYDGAIGIGGNKIYLEESGKGVFLDFGKNFGKYGVFYEEFLKKPGHSRHKRPHVPRPPAQN
jgi:ribonuclease J